MQKAILATLALALLEMRIPPPEMRES